MYTFDHNVKPFIHVIIPCLLNNTNTADRDKHVWFTIQWPIEIFYSITTNNALSPDYFIKVFSFFNICIDCT